MTVHETRKELKRLLGEADGEFSDVKKIGPLQEGGFPRPGRRTPAIP
jgi:hypothetical protein